MNVRSSASLLGAEPVRIDMTGSSQPRLDGQGKMMNRRATVTKFHHVIDSYRPYLRYNLLLFLAIFLAGVLSLRLAYELRFDFDVPIGHADRCAFLLPYVALVKLAVFYLLRGHSSSWRYVGMRDLVLIGVYSAVCAVILFSARLLGSSFAISRGVILVDAVLTLIAVGGIRMSARLVREVLFPAFHNGRQSNAQDAVIIGAGDAGEIILREIKRNPGSPYRVIALFDDDPSKRGRSIHGVTVEGNLMDVAGFHSAHPVEAAIVAIPSANGKQMKRINTTLRDCGIAVKTLPHIFEIMDDAPKVAQLRDIAITDILGREEVRTHTEQVRDLISGKVVVVTGAGGSIGSELCRQVLRRNPRRLIALEKTENSLFHLHRELSDGQSHGGDAVLLPLLCDVRDGKRLLSELRPHRPDLILHAAAHKHVALHELDPLECFKNNLGGIQTIAKVSDRLGVDRFVLISTDKAVNPTSIMGATKRVCEMYCQAYSKMSETKFMAVRFGNVLASEGSVVPIFMDQIAKGGPVTVTHPDVARYFMTVPEAVVLVLQAAALGASGHILMLEMGEPVKIVDLARQLIGLAGASEAQVPIEFVGLRPGEKLFEELARSNDGFRSTPHEKIKYLMTSAGVTDEFVPTVDSWIDKALSSPDSFDARQVLVELVPEYRPATPFLLGESHFSRREGDTGLSGVSGKGRSVKRFHNGRPIEAGV